MAKTHMVIKTTKQPAAADHKALLDLRANRFKAGSSTTTATGSTCAATSTSTDPAEAERLAARAARFADVKSGPAITTSGKVKIGSSTNITTSSVVDAEKLAKRAARFADIPKEATTTKTA